MMKKSIRYKLFSYMTVGIVVFAMLLFGANTFFAERYYIAHKKNILTKSSKEIVQLIQGMNNAADFMDEGLIYKLNRLEKSIGGSVVIGRTDGTIFYPITHDLKGQIRKALSINPFVVLGREGELFAKPRAKYQGLREGTIKSLEFYDINSFFAITKDPNLKIDTLRFQTRLENNITVLVWVPMTEVSESADVSNRFTAIVALITILITALWAFYISGRFTKPIKQINNTAKKMAALDFSQTLTIHGEDEIGELSESINYLSFRLSEAIGELNRRNRQLEQDIDRSKKIDSMRREFVSNVSHELKTPIFLIQGYAEGLKANVAGDEEKRSFYCDVIMEEAEKMDVIVKDLLNLSQIESGKMDLCRCDFDIIQLIQEIVKKLEPVFEEKGINVVCDFRADHQVNGDPVRIEQVMVNYLNNAINHIDGSKEVRIEAKSKGEKVHISVFNTGKPIPENLLDRIWASFYKVDKARTRGYGGTGLGLAIVKAIQQAHGNAYGVANKEDGVEFWFDVDIVNNNE